MNDSDDDSLSIGAISVASTYIDTIANSNDLYNDDISISSGLSMQPSITNTKINKHNHGNKLHNQQQQQQQRAPNYRGMYAYLASLIHVQVREEMDREKIGLSIDIQETRDNLISTLMTTIAKVG